RTGGVTKQIRVVALLPHEDEVRGGHEHGDEPAAGRRARKRVGGDAEPARVLLVVLAGPDLLGLVRDRLFDDACAPELEVLPFHGPNGSATVDGSAWRVQAVGPPAACPRRRFVALCCAAWSTNRSCACVLGPKL